MEGSGGSGILKSSQTPHRSSLAKFFTKTPMIKTILQQARSTFSQPEAKPAADPIVPSPAKPAVEPAPIDNSPRGLAKAAAEAAGFEQGKEYQAQTTKHRPSNKRLLWCTLDNWGEPVLYSVNHQDQWQPAERIWGVYVGPDAQGRLQFENRDGIRRNRWKARP